MSNWAGSCNLYKLMTMQTTKTKSNLLKVIKLSSSINWITQVRKLSTETQPIVIAKILTLLKKLGSDTTHQVYSKRIRFNQGEATLKLTFGSVQRALLLLKELKLQAQKILIWLKYSYILWRKKTQKGLCRLTANYCYKCIN